MKILAVLLAIGMSNDLLSNAPEFINNILSNSTENGIPTIAVKTAWECTYCGHRNGGWTSTCGFCGKTRVIDPFD